GVGVATGDETNGPGARRRISVPAPGMAAARRMTTSGRLPIAVGQETIAHEICRTPDPTDARDGGRGSNPKDAGRADRRRGRRLSPGAGRDRAGPVPDAAEPAPGCARLALAPGAHPRCDRGPPAPARACARGRRPGPQTARGPDLRDPVRGE